MNPDRIKLVAFDLDGTLTQHKSPLSDEMRSVLDKLGEKRQLLMVGAGSCLRIFKQMGGYPIDILGNYGLQYAKYNPDGGDLRFVYDKRFPCDRESVSKRALEFREKYGFTDYVGDSVEFHDSGVVTIALLGTKAELADKLAFDPDRSKRRAVYEEVKALFPDYKVFVGGSSSYDMAPDPYDKAYALAELCRERGLAHDEVLYVGDDYGPGGNDESVYKSDFNFMPIDDYRTTPSQLSFLL